MIPRAEERSEIEKIKPMSRFKTTKKFPDKDKPVLGPQNSVLQATYMPKHGLSLIYKKVLDINNYKSI